MPVSYTHLTLIGGLYVTFVCLVPYIMTSAWDVKFYFGGTSLLLVVVVIMDFIVQVQSHLMSSQYESCLLYTSGAINGDVIVKPAVKA